jgi:ATP-dependent DNA ligase
LDGEIVALDERGYPRFEWLVNRGPQKGTLVYYVFDLLKLGDVDLRGEPLHRRKKLLEKFLKGNPRLLHVEHVERDGLDLRVVGVAPWEMRRLFEVPNHWP